MLTRAQDTLAAPGTLTTARAVHDLPDGQAGMAIPVHLIAMVTYYQPQEESLYVSDDSGGVFIWVERPFPVKVGDQIEVTGVTRQSWRTVVRVTGGVRVLSHGHTVPAPLATFPEMMSGKLDCRTVSIRGTVRAANLEDHGSGTITQLQIMMPGGTVQAYIKENNSIDPSSLTDAEVEISGVAAIAFNATNALMRPKLQVSFLNSLKVLRTPQVRAWNLPPASIATIESSRFVLDQSRRVRLRGAVTSYEAGHSMVIQHDGRSLFILTRQLTALPLGSVVDVTGFVDDHAYSPVLEDGQFQLTGMKEHVEPREVTYAEAMKGTYSDALVSMRGEVLSQFHGERSDTVVIMVDGHPVDLVMSRQNRDTLPNLSLGTVITARGICRVTQNIEWTSPLLFRLDLRDKTDLQIVTRPSWWTMQHVIFTAGMLCALFSLILIWVVALRRKVKLQTTQIEQSMRVERQRSRLLEEINSDMPLDRLLEEITTSINGLMVGSHCVIILNATASLGRKLTVENNAAVPALPDKPLFDSSGKQLGTFRVLTAPSSILPKTDREILAIGAGLADLAIKQRGLYAELNHQSTHDQLTGLPNRRLSDSHLEAAIEAASGTRRIAVAYIDVDHFKEVNDSHGHKLGDLYLQEIARRLNREVRGPDLLARLGGDEFLLVAPGLLTARDGEQYRQRLQRCFQEPFLLDGTIIYGSASVGLAVFPENGRVPEELKRYADREMYREKRGHESSAMLTA